MRGSSQRLVSSTLKGALGNANISTSSTSTTSTSTPTPPSKTIVQAQPSMSIASDSLSPPPPKSAMVIVNPFSTGPVNVRYAYASVTKPSLDVWGTLYRSDSAGVADTDSAAGGGTGAMCADGDVMVTIPDDFDAFNASVGRWLEGFSLGRLGSRGGLLKRELADDDGVETASSSASSPSCADDSTVLSSSSATAEKNAKENKSSCLADLPELIVAFGGDSTVNSVVSLLHALDKEVHVGSRTVRGARNERNGTSASDVNKSNSAGTKTEDNTRTVAKTSSVVFSNTAVLIVPSGMSNGIAASMGTSPFIDRNVFASRVAGRDQARAAEAASAEGSWGGGAVETSASEANLNKDGGGGGAVSNQKPSSHTATSPSSAKSWLSSFTAKYKKTEAPLPPILSKDMLRYLSAYRDAKRIESRRSAERLKVGILQPRREEVLLPTYEVTLRPTGVALARMREDLRSSKRSPSGASSTKPNRDNGSSSSSSSGAETEDDALLVSHVGYCLGGISAGLWPSTKIKAHMMASLSEMYPGLPSLGPSSSLSFAAVREALRATPFPMSIHVGRATNGWGSRGKTLAALSPDMKINNTAHASDTDHPQVITAHPLPFNENMCRVGQIVGPFRLACVSALPSQGYDWSLTPSCAKGMWAADSRSCQQMNSSLSPSPHTIFPFTDRITVTTADSSATALRLMHLLFKEARRNPNRLVSSQCSAAANGSGISGSSSDVPLFYGVNTDKILREDGVEVYGCGSAVSAGDDNFWELNEEEDDDIGLDIDKPFTMAGIRNDAEVPLVGMFDGAPVKIPPHFILEMKPTGRAVRLWA